MGVTLWPTRSASTWATSCSAWAFPPVAWRRYCRVVGRGKQACGRDMRQPHRAAAARCGLRDRRCGFRWRSWQLRGHRRQLSGAPPLRQVRQAPQFLGAGHISGPAVDSEHAGRGCLLICTTASPHGVLPDRGSSPRWEGGPGGRPRMRLRGCAGRRSRLTWRDGSSTLQSEKVILREEIQEEETARCEGEAASVRREPGQAAGGGGTWSEEGTHEGRGGRRGGWVGGRTTRTSGTTPWSTS
jgi:hypothetical protein